MRSTDAGSGTRRGQRRRSGGSGSVALAAVLVLLSFPRVARGADEPGPSGRTLEIVEYRLEGVEHLTQLQVEAVLAPFLGPDRRLEDVEGTRVALEKAYAERGYQGVTVAIPAQTVRGGVVVLKVTEAKVGRLRVNGARWFSPAEIRREAPSLAEGTVPNLDALMRDVATLNQLEDRRVTPALRAGARPGTVDADLNVDDRLPLHASLELNNRQSSGTSALRLNGQLRDDNLWQRGHSLTFSFQTAPQHVAEAKVFSLTYLARFLRTPGVTLSLNGVVQNSDVSTLGVGAVRGRGRTAGTRLSFTLPGPPELYHGLTAGFDYKYYGKEQQSDPLGRPIRYATMLAQYTAALSGKSSQTLLTASAVASLRGAGSSEDTFDAKRVGATASFFHAALDASRTEDLHGGIQLAARFQGYLSPDPLIPSEQFSAGGADTVRGYLEAQASGDRVALGSLEVRSPSIAGWVGKWMKEWRFHLFAEGGWVGVNGALTEQTPEFYLWSAGGGMQLKIGPASGALDVGLPLRTLGTTRRYHPRIQFRLTTEF